MTARIIVVGNEKGGSGKTTIATNLAVLSALNGIDTLLVDADPGQKSSALWASHRLEGHPDYPRISCVERSDGRTIGPVIEDLATRYQTLIVDTGAVDSPALRACAMVADTLVVPVQPDALDVWALPTIANIYDRAQQLNPKLQARIVVNRILHQSAERAPAELREWMLQETPTLATHPFTTLVARAAYGRATGEGVGVCELKGRELDAKAANEMRAVYEAISQ
ncbi:AAA family ATPase [Novacetimonas hansenii]|uniref:Chromosome partitioning protein ParA n=1 Tax=Novacetimonas hansenii TaxID=436 RepID=A0ABQ0SHC6_NOVHA|nr:AAA family ATPase [Novacetimonas hansenii]GAN83785.1 cobyrinic acid a,c-diamide synthase [Novacetimonas hansenii JCM 7643]GBQ63041.1 putative partition protein [Novacetimonas hansenii NRIC 0243]GEC64190.1 chromosome partitioning protein ParA [Novacetimonas hansenii]